MSLNSRQIKEYDGEFDIVTYTGYTLEYLLENSDDKNCYKELLNEIDYLVDGKFEKYKKSYLLKFKGSSNQRIIDVKKSLESNNVVETEF